MSHLQRSSSISNTHEGQESIPKRNRLHAFKLIKNENETVRKLLPYFIEKSKSDVNYVPFRSRRSSGCDEHVKRRSDISDLSMHQRITPKREDIRHTFCDVSPHRELRKTDEDNSSIQDNTKSFHDASLKSEESAIRVCGTPLGSQPIVKSRSNVFSEMPRYTRLRSRTASPCASPRYRNFSAPPGALPATLLDDALTFRNSDSQNSLKSSNDFKSHLNDGEDVELNLKNQTHNIIDNTNDRLDNVETNVFPFVTECIDITNSTSSNSCLNSVSHVETYVKSELSSVSLETTSNLVDVKMPPIVACTENKGDLLVSTSPKNKVDYSSLVNNFDAETKSSHEKKHSRDNSKTKIIPGDEIKILKVSSQSVVLPSPDAPYGEQDRPKLIRSTSSPTSASDNASILSSENPFMKFLPKSAKVVVSHSCNPASSQSVIITDFTLVKPIYSSAGELSSKINSSNENNCNHSCNPSISISTIKNSLVSQASSNNPYIISSLPNSVIKPSNLKQNSDSNTNCNASLQDSLELTNNAYQIPVNHNIDHSSLNIIPCSSPNKQLEPSLPILEKTDNFVCTFESALCNNDSEGNSQIASIEPISLYCNDNKICEDTIPQDEMRVIRKQMPVSRISTDTVVETQRSSLSNVVLTSASPSPYFADRVQPDDVLNIQTLNSKISSNGELYSDPKVYQPVCSVISEPPNDTKLHFQSLDNPQDKIRQHIDLTFPANVQLDHSTCSQLINSRTSHRIPTESSQMTLQSPGILSSILQSLNSSSASLQLRNDSSVTAVSKVATDFNLTLSSTPNSSITSSFPPSLNYKSDSVAANSLAEIISESPIAIQSFIVTCSSNFPIFSNCVTVESGVCIPAERKMGTKTDDKGNSLSHSILNDCFTSINNTSSLPDSSSFSSVSSTTSNLAFSLFTSPNISSSSTSVALRSTDFTSKNNSIIISNDEPHIQSKYSDSIDSSGSFVDSSNNYIQMTPNVNFNEPCDEKVMRSTSPTDIIVALNPSSENLTSTSQSVCVAATLSDKASLPNQIVTISESMIQNSYPLTTLAPTTSSTISNSSSQQNTLRKSINNCSFISELEVNVSSNFVSEKVSSEIDTTSSLTALNQSQKTISSNYSTSTTLSALESSQGNIIVTKKSKEVAGCSPIPSTSVSGSMISLPYVIPNSSICTKIIIPITHSDKDPAVGSSICNEMNVVKFEEISGLDEISSRKDIPQEHKAHLQQLTENLSQDDGSKKTEKSLFVESKKCNISVPISKTTIEKESGNMLSPIVSNDYLADLSAKSIVISNLTRNDTPLSFNINSFNTEPFSSSTEKISSEATFDKFGNIKNNNICLAQSTNSNIEAVCLESFRVCCPSYINSVYVDVRSPYKPLYGTPHTKTAVTYSAMSPLFGQKSIPCTLITPSSHQGILKWANYVADKIIVNIFNFSSPEWIALFREKLKASKHQNLSTYQLATHSQKSSLLFIDNSGESSENANSGLSGEGESFSKSLDSDCWWSSDNQSCKRDPLPKSKVPQEQWEFKNLISDVDADNELSGVEEIDFMDEDMQRLEEKIKQFEHELEEDLELAIGEKVTLSPLPKYFRKVSHLRVKHLSLMSKKEIDEYLQSESGESKSTSVSSNDDDDDIFVKRKIILKPGDRRCRSSDFYKRVSPDIDMSDSPKEIESVSNPSNVVSSNSSKGQVKTPEEESRNKLFENINDDFKMCGQYWVSDDGFGQLDSEDLANFYANSNPSGLFFIFEDDSDEDVNNQFESYETTIDIDETNLCIEPPVDNNEYQYTDLPVLTPSFKDTFHKFAKTHTSLESAPPKNFDETIPCDANVNPGSSRIQEYKLFDCQTAITSITPSTQKFENEFIVDPSNNVELSISQTLSNICNQLIDESIEINTTELRIPNLPLIKNEDHFDIIQIPSADLPENLQLKDIHISVQSPFLSSSKEQDKSEYFTEREEKKTKMAPVPPARLSSLDVVSSSRRYDHKMLTPLITEAVPPPPSIPPRSPLNFYPVRSRSVASPQNEKELPEALRPSSGET